MIAGDRTQRNVKKSSIPERTPSCSPGPRPPRRPPGHSRESGNACGRSLRGELASLEDGCPAYTQWIPAYTGMTRKCRVRIAHAALTSGETVGLRSCHRYDGAASRRGMKRVRSAHPTIVRTKICHSRPRLQHSRAGYSGNPFGFCLREERLNIEANFLVDAKWIPAYAGMTGWPTGWPWARASATSGDGWRDSSINRPARGGSPTFGHTPVGKHKQNVGWVEERNPTSPRNRKPVGVRSSPQPTRNAKWIPAFPGMTGWPWARARATIGMGWPALTLGMPVTAASMRCVGHALPRTKHTAAPGNAKKYRAQISYAGLLVRRCDEWNRVAFVASIHSKISAIHGNYAVFWKNFAHSDQAKIGEVGLAVTVVLRQCSEFRQMFVAIKCQADKSVLKHCQYQPGILKTKGGFCEHRFTRKQRFGNLRSQMQRPLVVGIATIHKRDQKTGIGDAFQAREKPLPLDRPFGPFTLPARRINPWLAAVFRAFSSCSRTNLPFDTPDLAAVSSSQAASSSLTRIEIV